MSSIYSLSVKEINNKPTKICRKDNTEVFMSRNNQINLTKQIYSLHKNNHGILGYLYFKSMVPNRMAFWISNKNLSSDINTDKFIDIITFLNNNFIKDNYDLYEFKSRDCGLIPDRNVYKSEASLGYALDDGTMNICNKKFKDLSAEDMKNLDVWELQSTVVTNNNKRYKNEIPAWQKSMNTRHYSRDNEGLHAPSNRSSLNTFVNGYGDDMIMLQDLKNNQLKKYN